MRRGKHTYNLEQMISMDRQAIQQFTTLYLERNNIMPSYIEKRAYETWKDDFQFDQLAQWQELFQSPNMAERHILIVGDYDVDGMMSSKIALWLCEQCGVEIVDIYIPNRFTDGYGLNKNIVQRAIDDGFDTILTVDNGISAFEALAYAKESGIDVFLTDHHHLREIPDLTMILHPDLGSVNGGINICGTAVIFALAYTLFPIESRQLLPYVMLATLADSMELYMLNRAFVLEGIEMWSQLEDPFLQKLATQLEIDTTKPDQFAWKLIPVLNAIGRMDDVNSFADVLFWSERNVDDAIQEAVRLNQTRKEETERIVSEVMMQKTDERSLICAASETWHQGVLGIAASRIVEATKKPVLLFAKSEKGYKGSGRSPENFHLFDFLHQHANDIHAFGGHAQACGITLLNEQYEKLQTIIAQLPEQEERIHYIDYDISDLDGKDLELLYKTVNQLAPFGNGMPQPSFHTHVFEKQLRFMGKAREHVKFTLPSQMQLLFFNETEQWRLTEQADVHVIGPLSVNQWQDTITYQSIVADWWIDGVEFFFPNQLPIGIDIQKEATIISTIPETEQAFYALKQDVLKKGLCILQWQDAQKHVFLVDDKQLRSIYKYFLQKQKIDINQSFYNMMKRYDIEKNVVNFAIKVFLELEFVIIEGGVLSIQKTPDKKQLSASNIYQKMKFQYRFVEQVVYASHQKRKELFEQLEE